MSICMQLCTARLHPFLKISAATTSLVVPQECLGERQMEARERELDARPSMLSPSEPHREVSDSIPARGRKRFRVWTPRIRRRRRRTWSPPPLSATGFSRFPLAAPAQTPNAASGGPARLAPLFETKKKAKSTGGATSTTTAPTAARDPAGPGVHTPHRTGAFRRRPRQRRRRHLGFGIRSGSAHLRARTPH